MIIRHARAIKTNDTGGYAWANLRRFQNVSVVENEIIRLHELKPHWHSNARKQATQLRYCLTQAREYSNAAAAVSLATKPTLLYYSLMSLALAEILFKQSGLSSLDKARAQHRHHGLLFSHQPGPTVRGKLLVDAAAEFSALPMIGADGRMGTFHLWHNSCREMPLVGKATTYLGTGTTTTTSVILGSGDTPLDLIPEGGLTLLDCLLALPGMMEHLAMQNIVPGTLRGRVNVGVYSQEVPARTVTQVTIHPGPLAAEFFGNVMFAPVAVHHVDLVELPNGGWFTVTSDAVRGGPGFSIPHGSSWTDEEVRFWPRSMPLNEFGYLYIALFIAGNYARYYPDRWLLDVETCSPLALAIEELVSIVEQRMAWLTLSELSRIYFVTAS